VEKSPDPGVKKAAEQLVETHQKLIEVNKLTQKSNPNNEELNKIKEQLNNSRQTIAAAAAHRQPLLFKKNNHKTEVKSVAPSQPKSHVSYLIGGLVILGVSVLILGYFLGQRKKEDKN